MISEKIVDGVTIRTEINLLLGNVRIIQKWVENGDVTKINPVFLDRMEMDALVEDYQSNKTQKYFDDYEKTEGSGR